VRSKEGHELLVVELAATILECMCVWGGVKDKEIAGMLLGWTVERREF
jgi:hypothetical protein